MQRFLSSLPRASLASDSALPAKASKSMPAGDASMTRALPVAGSTSNSSSSWSRRMSVRFMYTTSPLQLLRC